MATVLVTGAHGLIGSESVAEFCRLGYDVVGIDNDMRSFGSVRRCPPPRTRSSLERTLFRIMSIMRSRHFRPDGAAVQGTFWKFGKPSIGRVIHTAAQPSHDWAARDPQADFGVNAPRDAQPVGGRRAKVVPRRSSSSRAQIKFTATPPIVLPLKELDEPARWEIEGSSHPFFHWNRRDDVN